MATQAIIVRARRSLRAKRIPSLPAMDDKFARRQLHVMFPGTGIAALVETQQVQVVAEALSVGCVNQR